MKKSSKAKTRGRRRDASAKGGPVKRGKNFPQKGEGRKPVKDKKPTKAELDAALAEKQQELLSKLATEEGFSLLDDEDVETLIDVPNRKPLDTSESAAMKHGLVRVSIDRPFQYKRFLQFLREGASFVSACLACDLGTALTVKGWIAQGAVDAAETLDSVFSRFYRDVMRVLATKRVEVEMSLAVKDGKFWLRNGPGRMIDNLWRDDPVAKPGKVLGPMQHQEMIADGDILKIESYAVVESEIVEEGPNSVPADDNAYAAALSVMEEQGLMESPEGWQRALRMQGGLGLDEADLEEPAQEEVTQTLLSNTLLLTKQAQEAQS